MPASEPHSAAQPKPESTEGQRADLEVMRRAIGDADNPPSFHHLVTAWRRSQWSEDPELRAAYAAILADLLEAAASNGSTSPARELIEARQPASLVPAGNEDEIGVMWRAINAANGVTDASADDEATPARERGSAPDNPRTALSFHHIVTAWKRSQRCEDPDLRGKYAKLVPHLLEAFEITRQRVISAQLYERTCAVAVLTDTDEAVRRGGRAIHLDPGDVHLSDAHKLRAGCQDLHNRALNHLPSKPRSICIGQAFEVLTTLFAELNALATVPEQTWSSLREQLDQAREYYVASLMRTARLRYLVGTLLGVLPYVAAVALFVPTDILSEREHEQLVAALVAGAIGGTMSVMIRVTGKALRLDSLEESSPFALVALGALRPTIGAMFGAVVFMLIVGRIVPIDLPGGSAALFFIAGFAFAAGFNERFARDSLSRVEAAMPPVGSTASEFEPHMP